MYNFKKRVGLAIGTADPNDEDIQNTATGLGGLLLRSGLVKKVPANNNSLQNFDSFVVTDPDLVDEGIDVSGLRTTTDVSPYLLGGIPDYEGIRYESYNPNRLTDLMRLYSSGLPTTATDTAQIPGAVDTLVDVGSGDGGQATLPIDTIQPIDTPITTDLTDDQINEFATEDTTMPPMLSSDMVGGIDTTPVDTTPPNMSPLADEQFVDTDSGLNYLNNVTDEELYGITEAEQTPPGGGDPEMFYDAPETYSPISPGLDDLLDDATLTSAQAPQSQMPQGSPGQLNPYEPQSLADEEFARQNTGLEDLLDQAEATDAEIYGEPLDAEDYLGTSTPQEINIETAIEPQAVNTILGPDGITYDAVTGNPIYEDLDAQAAATDLQVADLPLEQTNQILEIINNAGNNIEGALTELGKIPGAVVDKFNETVDVFGKKINVGKTIASALVNKAVGAPVSLVFDVIGSLASNLPSGISTTTNKAREVGLLTGDNTVTQDIYGINTQSAFGDYDKYNVDRVEQLEGIVADQLSRGLTNTIQMRELEDRKEYVDRSGAGGDIQPDATDIDIAADSFLGDGAVAEDAQDLNLMDVKDDMAGINTGDASIAEQIAKENRIEETSDYDGPSVDTGPIGPQFEDQSYSDPGVDAEENQPGGDGPGTSSGPSGPTGNYEGAGVGGPAGQGSPQSTGPTDKPGGADAGTESFGNENVGGSPTGISGPPSQGGTATTGPSGPPSQGGGGGGGDGCFLAGTLVTMADGSTKPVEQVDLKDNVAEGGKVFATGKFLVENLHDYKGIKVSGSHMVNEDNKWVRVENSKHGKSLGDDEHTVYVFGSENRRILINGILFTDYFEVKEQEKFLENEKKFFKNWKQFSNEHNESNLNILNAS